MTQIETHRDSAWRLVWRAVRLRCPSCGRANIFSGWFTMPEACPACGRPSRRGEGFFLGSIYFNYGVTGSLSIVIYFSLFFSDLLTDPQRLALLTAFVVAFPIWFFRYARALWMAFDEYWDPWQKQVTAQGAPEENRT